MLDVPVGLENRLTITSSAKDSAENFGNAGVDVVATPALIGFLEQAAGRALRRFMAPDEVTVGTMVDVQHLGAAPVGATIDCHARVTAVDDRRITFAVEARWNDRTLMKGRHGRAIVDGPSFFERLQQLSSGA